MVQGRGSRVHWLLRACGTAFKRRRALRQGSVGEDRLARACGTTFKRRRALRQGPVGEDSLAT
eukprot:1142088-Pelagomonas_calceolata.AAC.3